MVAPPDRDLRANAAIRIAALNEAVAILEGLDRTGREWVRGSLWSNIFRDGIAAIRHRAKQPADGPIAASLEKRATLIANEVCGGPPQRCYGWKAKIWQSAWDGAYRALGGEPDQP